MPMMRKIITISDTMEEWVKSQIDSGRYANDSEYFRDLIRRDQDRRAAEERLSSLIEEGLSSGISDDNIPGIMARVESKLRRSNSK